MAPSNESRYFLRTVRTCFIGVQEAGSGVYVHVATREQTCNEAIRRTYEGERAYEERTKGKQGKCW